MVIPSQREYPQPPRPASRPRSGPVADVVELIMADHRRIRRLREVFDNAVRRGAASGSAWIPGHVWERLAVLLEVHISAEEEICYLPMSRSRSHPAEWRQAAVADHDDIREAIGEAALQPAGSALWWAAVRSALAISAAQLDREERDMLGGWLPSLTMSQRLELGRQWLAFVSTWRLQVIEGKRSGTRAGRARSG